MVNLLIGIIMLIWGGWAMFAGFLGKKLQFFTFFKDIAIFKWVLGDASDKIMNVLFGFVWFVIGFIMVCDYLGL